MGAGNSTLSYCHYARIVVWKLCESKTAKRHGRIVDIRTFRVLFVVPGPLANNVTTTPFEEVERL